MCVYTYILYAYNRKMKGDKNVSRYQDGQRGSKIVKECL